MRGAETSIKFVDEPSDVQIDPDQSLVLKRWPGGHSPFSRLRSNSIFISQLFHGSMNSR
jgi:hypothetical protein